jgi:hypothetical protein
VWYALRYVLNNARTHGAWTSRTRPDSWSSSAWFDGWHELQPEAPESPPVARARTWLLRLGWRFFGFISIDAAPVFVAASRGMRPRANPS